MGSLEQMDIEIAYACGEAQTIIPIKIKVSATLREAIDSSGVLQAFSEINLNVNKVGVFGKLGELDDILRAGDRVEIYRALIADPREVRRRRASQRPKID